jgi:hypothetical protein
MPMTRPKQISMDRSFFTENHPFELGNRQNHFADQEEEED